MGILDTATSWTLDNLKAWLGERFNPASRPVYRFKNLIAAHGVTLAQVLRLVPESWAWSLESLSSNAELRKALTTDRLEWLAQFFGVRRPWLEGASFQIYEPFYIYKHQDALRRVLEESKLLQTDLEILAFSSTRKPLDRSARPIQEVTLVMSVPIAQFEVNDRPIRRYVVCGDSWNWGHPPCRWQLKLLARAAWTQGKVSIPIVPIKGKWVTQLAEGRLFPGPLDPFHIGNLLCLEDYALSEEESAVAREADELERIPKHPDAELELFTGDQVS